MSDQDQSLLKIKNHAIEHVKREGVITSNLFLENIPFKRGQIIPAGETQFNTDRNTFLVFCDDEPAQNWGHNCRYLLYDTDSGEMYKEISSRFPPRIVNPSETFVPIQTNLATKKQLAGNVIPFEPLHLKESQKKQKPLFPNYKGNRYALLFSGNSNDRHVYDLEYLYRMLLNIYGFDPANIYILNYDGSRGYSDFYNSDVYYRGHSGHQDFLTMKVNGAGTISEINNVIDELKKRLKEDDLFFIHTNNHGIGAHDKSMETQSSLCTYDSSGRIIEYESDDFALKLSELPKFARLLVMMEQCHSGGFCDSILSNSPANETCFTAACEAYQSSTGETKTHKCSNIFTFWWTSCLHGPDYKSGGKNSLSAQQTFLNAKRMIKEDASDSPVLGDKPSGCGNTMFLGQ